MYYVVVVDGSGKEPEKETQYESKLDALNEYHRLRREAKDQSAFLTPYQWIDLPLQEDRPQRDTISAWACTWLNTTGQIIALLEDRHA